MSIRISNENLTTFLGDTVAIYLCSDNGVDIEDVKWSYSEEGIAVNALTAPKPYGTSAGLIVSFIKCGEFTFTAEHRGIRYTSKVTVRERRRFEDDEPLSFYRGDLHVHTSMIHQREPFLVRKSEFPYDMLREVCDEGKLDFTVISDHGDVLCDREFLRGFIDADRFGHSDTVIFPGSESEATFLRQDRFGTLHKHSGEVVVMNSVNYSAAETWEEFVEDHLSSPLPLAVFAHPQVVGGGETGLWNNEYARNYGRGLERIIRMVEMGNGQNREENLIHERSYPDALDAGFFVSCTCSSDAHASPFGMKACTGKTIIMASEKSKEAFIDAIDKRRVYASESGNVKLSYSVNGIAAPAILPLTDTYVFNVKIDYFDELLNTEIISCTVVSDYGERLLTVDAEGKGELSFSVSSDSARYFFLRLVDRDGKKTWSTPVLTGRAYDKYEEKSYTPIPESEYEVIDGDGNKLDVLKNRDLLTDVIFDSATPRVTVCLKEKRRVSALGVCHLKMIGRIIRASGIPTPDYLKSFMSQYRISVSVDGISYDTVREGRILVFGDEQILDFEPREVKYVRLEGLVTVGGDSSVKKYEDAMMRLSEISVFD